VETRFYRALIVQDDGDGPEDGYGVVFPDLPGCTSSGDTVEQAYEHAFEALALHIEGMLEEHAPLPEPSPFNAPLPHWLSAEGGTIERAVLVPIKLPGRAIRISITMDKGLLSRLDTTAAANGDTRSGYIAEAVRERMEREHGRSGTRPHRSARDDTARRQL
jgi:predicted RNase H-like HicB family nuclease